MKSETNQNSFLILIKNINPVKIAKDIVDVITHIMTYFKKIDDTNITPALSTFAFYGIIIAALKIIFNIADITLISTILNLLYIPGAILIGFMIAGLYSGLAFLLGGNINFNAAIKATASIGFIYPLSVLLYKIAFNYTLLVIFSLIGDIALIAGTFFILADTLKNPKLASIIFSSILALGILYLTFSNYATFYLMLKNASIAAGNAMNGLLGGLNLN